MRDTRVEQAAALIAVFVITFLMFILRLVAVRG